MVDNKNKGPGEFDDDAFDDADFSDADFDEAAFEEDDAAAFEDLPADDAEFEGDDFESEEWAEEEAADDNKKSKKQKNKKAKSGSSFNTIVIIGAVIVGGGVMMVNIMSKSAEQQAKGPAKSVFQSILNIGGVMDGALFAEEEKSPLEEQAEQDQAGGFMNDPNSALPTPPQPAPIAPTDGATGEPLTPMPPSAEAPRGPEDAPPQTENTLATDQTPSAASAVAPMVEADATAPAAPEASATQTAATETPAAETPAEPTPPSSAENILKQALANREQKQQGETPDVVPAVPEVTPTETPVEEAKAPEEKPAEEKPAEEKVAEAPAVETPAPAPVVVEATVPAETKEEIESNKQAVASLEGKIDTLLKRMDQIENDLGTIREDKSANVEQIEKTVASLKDDISEIKSRPATAAPAVKSSDDETEEAAPKPVANKKKPKSAPVAEDDVYTPPKTAIVPAAAPAPKPAPVKAASGSWELRAAQPGRAWVSKPGERDMQAVAVGETLAGVGKVTAITYQNGRWTVMGTQGIIQQ